MLFLFRNRQIRLLILFHVLLITGECDSQKIRKPYEHERKTFCQVCGFEFDDCSSSTSAVEECSKGTSFCFKIYNTSNNRLEKGCSNGTTQAEWETIIKLASAGHDQTVCYDVTKTNLEMITQCQEYLPNYSNCSFETVSQINPTSQQDVSKMTSKKCICYNNTGSCNKGDVPGFEEIQRAKEQVNQCYACSFESDKLCEDVKGKPEAVTKWCRTQYCSVTKRRKFSFRDFLTAEAKYQIDVKRDCADHYEDPGKTLECLKGSKDGCINVRKLWKCSPIKSQWVNRLENYNENDQGEDMKECVCEGNLCNDKLKDEIKLNAGGETGAIISKELILIVSLLIETFS